MARKPKIQTRVERDTKDAIDTYTDDHDDLSQSEAVRHLIRAGLAQKGYPVAAADGGRVRSVEDTTLEKLAAPRTMRVAAGLMLLSGVFMVFSTWFAQGGMFWPALVGTGITMISIVLAAVIATVAMLAQMALARPLRELTPFGTGETA